MSDQLYATLSMVDAFAAARIQLPAGLALTDGRAHRVVAQAVPTELLLHHALVHVHASAARRVQLEAQRALAQGGAHEVLAGARRWTVQGVLTFVYVL